MAGAQANISTFIAPTKGPGRIAPTLIEDLTLYDPYLNPLHGRHLLEDPPVNFGNTEYLHQVLQKPSCRHAFYLQPRQTQAPRLDEVPDRTSVYRVTAFCRLCRIHLTLTVDYKRSWKGRPCPNADRPIHHLVYSGWNSGLARSNYEKQHPNTPSQFFVYACSSPACGVIVTVQLSPSVLSLGEVHVLTDMELLRQRTDQAFEAKRGDTEGMKRPSPTDVLGDLRAYIRNSWNKDSRSEIALDNKRFAVRFGPNGTACEELLKTLAFELRPGNPGAWLVPRPTSDHSFPLQNMHDIFLDNLEHELSALILGRPDEERIASQDMTTLEVASKEFSRALGCQSYDRAPSSRTAGHMPADRPSPFIVLGIPEDVNDSIVGHAYDWQCSASPGHGPTFLSALRDIANLRNSESLQTKYAIETSKDLMTAEQLGEACKALGLATMISPDEADEDHIIGVFTARLQDSPAQEAELRHHLRTIGAGLRSKRIHDFANRDITTYEQALEFLGAQTDTGDDFIQALYVFKLESPSQKDLADKAVKIIATTRGSESLQAWVTSGFSSGTDTTMDVGEAFHVLGIQDRLMDDHTILSVYKITKSDDEINSDRYARALKAIAQDRNSAVLYGELHMVPSEPSNVSSQEPVGLDNIGNTCYLNSLLQSFFTIKRIRDMVLDFDTYKMDLAPENMAIKKVGQRKISRSEVEKAQKFITNLALLFQSMITTTKSAVRPEQELARLTLETHDAQDKIRRRSTLAGGHRPSLGSIDNRMIHGPLPAPTLQTNGILEESPLASPEMTDKDTTNNLSKQLTPESIEDTSSLRTAGDDDNSSEATLVSRPSSTEPMELDAVSTEQQQSILDNKENWAPAKELDHRDISTVAMEPLRPASPSKINVQAGALISKPEPVHHVQLEDKPIIYQPPPVPPPIPPRKPVNTAINTLEEFARQQDVTEVFNHAILQMSVAIKPTGFEKSGEQLDEIHDLMFGNIRRHTVSEQNLADPEPFLWIPTHLQQHPKDLYGALDSYFDKSDSERKDYLSVTRLPPVLSIAFLRADWNYETNREIKLEDYVEMPEQIFMDRYVEADEQSELMQRRKSSWDVKERLSRLVREKAFLEKEHAGSKDVPSLYDDTRRILLYLSDSVAQEEEYGGPIPIDSNLPDYFGDLAAKSRIQLAEITCEIKELNQQLSDQFAGLREHSYRLHAVFFHRGGTGSGHYWVYIRDHKTGLWRKYNDDHVTVVQDTKEIFGKPETTGGWSGPANAYFLIYVRCDAAGNVDELVETVKREPVVLNDMEELLEPFGGWESGTPAPSQMTEVPPGYGYDSETTAAWAEERTTKDKLGDWDDSEAQGHGVSTWYK